MIRNFTDPETAVTDLDNSPNVLYKGQNTIVQTEVFRDWLEGLRDRKARLRIDAG